MGVLAGIRYDFPQRGLADLVTSLDEVLAAPAQVDEVLSLALQLEEICCEQAADPWFRTLISSREAYSLFDLNDSGILLRKAPPGGAEQIVVPPSLRPVFSTWSISLESPDTRASLACSVPYADITSGNTCGVTLRTRSRIELCVLITVSPNGSGRGF
jgi:hypothetical protein